MGLDDPMDDWDVLPWDVVHDDVPDLVRDASEVGKDEEVTSVESRFHRAATDVKQSSPQGSKLVISSAGKDGSWEA
jgi:hypothetical protein